MTFEYYPDVAIDVVNDITTSLNCDLNGVEKLAELMESGDYCFGDMEEQDESAYQCYERIIDEVYGRLEDLEIIPNNFNEEYESEADVLGDYIDDQVELFLEMVRDWE